MERESISVEAADYVTRKYHGEQLARFKGSAERASKKAPLGRD